MREREKGSRRPNRGLEDVGGVEVGSKECMLRRKGCSERQRWREAAVICQAVKRWWERSDRDGHLDTLPV